MLAHQCFELAHQPRVLAGGQIRVDPILQRGQTSFLQPRDLGLGERFVGEIRQRRTPPHPQRLTQDSCRGQRIALLERPAALRDERLEPVDVELAGLDPEHVAATPGDQQSIAERLTQVRYVPLNELVRARGRLLTPQLVDQAICGNRLAAVQKQHRQQCPLLGRAQRERAVSIDGLKRSEDAKLHHVRAPLPTLPPPGPLPKSQGCGYLPVLDRFSTGRAHLPQGTDRTRRSTSQRSQVEMTNTYRIATIAAVLLTLVAAGAPRAGARPADFVPAGKPVPASVYSRADKSMIAVGPPATPAEAGGRLTALQSLTRQARHRVAAISGLSDKQLAAAFGVAPAAANKASVPQAAVRIQAPPSRFDWGDAGIGAAGGLALAMLCVVGALVISQRPRRTRHSTARSN